MFSKFKKDKPKKTLEESISAGLRGTILNFLGSRGLPSMPNSAQKAFRLTVDPNASAKDFIDVIESDESLSARILKISNSVYFDRGTPAQTIEESVNKIGLNELRCLLNANSLPELLPSSNSIRPQLWSNDIATAIIAKRVAQMKNPQHQDTAFLAGLMHDIGKLLLLQRLDTQFNEILRLVQFNDYDFCMAEEEVLAFNHCELGQLIGEKWNFSPDLISVIRNHHQPWNKLDISSSQLGLPAIVKIADLIAHTLAIGHGPGFSKFRARCEEELNHALPIIGVQLEQKKSFLEQCHKHFEMEAELYLS